MRRQEVQRRLVSITGLLFAVLAQVSLAALVIGEDIQLGDTSSVVGVKLKSACESIEYLSVEPPVFPMSVLTEAHIICQEYRAGSIVFDRVAFTFADDSLVHMEAHGVELQPVAAALGSSSGQYLGFSYYGAGSHWLDSDEQLLLWLNEEGRHLNLFTWRNPFLVNSTYGDKLPAAELPGIVVFNSSLEEIFSVALRDCGPAQMVPEDRIWLQNNPSKQVQINCFNYRYAGFNRKLELVFGDGKLEVVWVLTGKGEERRLREWLMGNWGGPILENEVWEVFADGRISLRKDKPELLILSAEMMPIYLNIFNSQSN
jgi:hypothetical protein